MKELLCALLLGSTAICPSSLPATPCPPSATHAVVVGISDYQSSEIPDLQFADRDAEAFAAYLQSPAGGSLPAENVKLLTNKYATTAGIAVALDWLLDVSKAGDLAIVYFAGHADAEAKTYAQEGFLLPYDSPSRVYRAGAYSILYFHELVTSLCLEKKARVTLFLDIAHGGTPAGSATGGSAITASELARPYANETKILSCQPGESSLEGPQWGGGRSAFSYHLLRGLYGLADENTDGQVTLLELSKYLENQVGSDVAPHAQKPMAIGSRETTMATVSPEMLAMVQEPGLALGRLELQIGYGLSYEQIMSNYRWAPLRDLPDFEALLRKYFPEKFTK